MKVDLREKYIWILSFALLIANALLAVISNPGFQEAPRTMVAAFAALAAFAECRPFPMPSGGGFTLTSAISLGFLWAFGPVAALTIEAAALITAAFIQGTRLVKVVYNILQISVSLQLAGIVFHGAAGISHLGGAWPVVPALLSSAVHLAANSMLVSTAIGLVQQKPFRQVWARDLSHVWAFWILFSTTGFILETLLTERGYAAFVIFALAITSLWVIFENHKRLLRYAHTDELTGLFNYRRLKAELEKTSDAVGLGKRKLALIILDLDNFKSVNDRFGHEVGNRVIQAAAAIIKQNTRGNDMVFRFGGEEFCVLLFEVTKDSAVAVAERIRVSLERELSAADPCLTGTSITASFGVSVFPDDTNTIRDLLPAADKALYQAKSSGKNRVCAAG